MKRAAIQIAVAAALAMPLSCALAQTNHYVWSGGNNTSPYTSWTSAARVIQDAIDASADGDVILVTNGTYNTGGRPHTAEVLTNRVYIDKAITVRSVNGPSNTFIFGRWNVPGGNPADNNNVLGDASVRCAYLAAGSTLIGFTLTNGATRRAGQTYGGGVCGANSNTVVVSNCLITGNNAWSGGGGIFRATVYDSVISRNFTATNVSLNTQGGGALQSRLYRTLVTANESRGSEYFGGGAWGSTLYDSTVSHNTAGSLNSGYGGGAGSSTLYNCNVISNFSRNGGGASADAAGNNRSVLYSSRLIGNTGYLGGGARQCSLYNCELIGNTATVMGGGGARESNLYNCLLMGNVTLPDWRNTGGGALGGVLYNCTVVGNSAFAGGGGVSGCTAWNSVVYSNNGGSGAAAYCNYTNTTFYYSCTWPDPGGVENFTNYPGFMDSGAGYGANLVAGNYRLQRVSPCINTGTNFAYMTDPAVLATNECLGRDLDGNPRIGYGVVDRGAYEYVAPGTMFFIRGRQ